MVIYGVGHSMGYGVLELGLACCWVVAVSFGVWISFKVGLVIMLGLV